MPNVETVTGPIDADELGTTLIHEHLVFRDEAVLAEWPHAGTVKESEPPVNVDEEGAFEAALESARAVVEHGVKTIAEPTAMFGGRDVRFSRRVAEETGLQVVPCTGIYTYDYLPPYFMFRDEDAMADLFVHDIEEGIQGTDIKAAFLKCAADEPGVTPNIEKVHRAAARASVRTGTPIMAHSRPASETGPRQVEIFIEEGVEPERIQIAHTGDTDDLDYIERLLDTGVFVGMDRYGLEIFLPMEQRNATVTALLERGYAERMFLSQDFCATLDWYPAEVATQMMEAGAAKGWSMTLIFEEVIPALRESGMTDEQLETMMVSNPKRWLTA
ncbi:MAG: phosphotriesterase [Actinobacteria bacterium]|jgi:phosphotriesterase-related protein|nr:MAG: phosphotriesterase [Actinomycetota bacterium]